VYGLAVRFLRRLFSRQTEESPESQLRPQIRVDGDRAFVSVPTFESPAEAKAFADAHGLSLMNEEEARRFADDPRWPDEDDD
jgi:hypothetical protein